MTVPNFIATVSCH